MPLYFLHSLYVRSKDLHVPIKSIVTSESYWGQYVENKPIDDANEEDGFKLELYFDDFLSYGFSYIFKWGLKDKQDKFFEHTIDEKYDHAQPILDIWMCLHEYRSSICGKLFAHKRYYNGPIELYYACFSCDEQRITFTYNKEKELKPKMCENNGSLLYMTRKEMWQDDADVYPAPFLMTLLRKDIDANKRIDICIKAMKIISKHWQYSKDDVKFIFNQKYLNLRQRKKVFHIYFRLFRKNK